VKAVLSVIEYRLRRFVDKDLGPVVVYILYTDMVTTVIQVIIGEILLSWFKKKYFEKNKIKLLPHVLRIWYTMYRTSRV